MPPSRTPQDKAIDPASVAMLEKAAADGASDAFARADAQGKSCTFGTDGVCCRLCHMGPCRIMAKSPLGVCGADADTIAARNLLREVAAGSAAHSDHGRSLVLLLKAVAEGRSREYQIRDGHRLRTAAVEWGVSLDEGDAETRGRGDAEKLKSQKRLAAIPKGCVFWETDERRAFNDC